ncbi:NADAR family protein [Aquimarina sediminis]|uniref:NADAR family protein n=1 Tax=Aquimarina sediminis TaxID=2070536 RepID=UPI0019D4A99B|nr:NADAR family protein [Aquimarina sediminis]
MKDLLNKVLSSVIDNDLAKELVELEEKLDSFGSDFLDKLPARKLIEYGKAKGRIQRQEAEKEYSKMTQRELEIKHLRSFQPAANHVIGLTLGDELLLKAKERKEEKFTFFWATKSPFSQWHKCNFIGGRMFRASDYLLKRFDNKQVFSSTEQYMMYHKCLLSLDFDAAQEVLSTKDPKKQKQIGRSVKMTEEILETWEVFKAYVVYDANKAKFTQNEDLKKALIATKGTTLVEAAPNDKTWGIGLAEDDPRVQNRETWQGKNLLGEILTKIRIEITGEY